MGGRFTPGTEDYLKGRSLDPAGGWWLDHWCLSTDDDRAPSARSVCPSSARFRFGQWTPLYLGTAPAPLKIPPLLAPWCRMIRARERRRRSCPAFERARTPLTKVLSVNPPRLHGLRCPQLHNFRRQGGPPPCELCRPPDDPSG